MHIRSLEAFGISPQLLDIWEREYGPELLPAQAEAAGRTNLLRGGSLIVYAPTGAGKTLIGEMAALQAATHGRRALLLVPTKALAEEKYALLSRLYAPLGLRVIISTRDRRRDDSRLLRGDFDLAVAVPEKAHYLFNLSQGAARALGCVVVDELQMIGDPQRGPTLEVTLAHLRATCPGLQIVGLSAVMGAPGSVAEWLNAEWLEVRRRPVELRRGVLADGVFRYREYNTGQGGEERWPVDLEETDWEEAAARLARWLAAQGEPTLVFLPDRPSAVRMALRLAEEGGASPLSPLPLQGRGNTQERLAALPRTATRERLREVAAAGVAFHSSDLQFEERRIIEEGFAAGEIMILCSTSTLALGVNLPARNVILAPECWEQPLGPGRPTLTPLGRAEYENMGGRAGRPRLGEDFGRSILLADSTYQQEALLERYTTPGLDPPAPALAGLSPLQQLALLCGAEGGGAEDLAELYRHTLTAWTRGEQNTEALPAALQAALRSAERYGLLAAAEPERLRVTPLGRLAAGSGTSLEGFYWLSRWLERPHPLPPLLAGEGVQRAGSLALLFLAALTPEAMALYFPLGPRGPRAPDWLGELQRQAEASDLPLLQALRETGERSAEDKARAARLVLTLLRWVGEESTDEIEEAVQVPAGRLAVAGETVSWLVGLAVQIGAERGWAGAPVEEAEALAARLAAGLPAQALALGQALRGIAGRDRVLSLVAAGMRGEADLARLSPGEWRRLVPEAEGTEILRWREAPGPTPAGRRRRRANASPPPAGPAPTAGASPPDPFPWQGRGQERGETTEPPSPLPCALDRLAALSDRVTPREGPESTALPPPPLPGEGAGGEAPLLYLDLSQPHRVLFHGREIYLRPAEWRLLAALAAEPGRCVSFARLLETMWSPGEAVEGGQLNWHRHHLAKKLAAALPPGEVLPLRTIPRRGYCLELPPGAVAVTEADRLRNNG